MMNTRRIFAPFFAAAIVLYGCETDEMPKTEETPEAVVEPVVYNVPADADNLGASLLYADGTVLEAPVSPLLPVEGTPGLYTFSAVPDADREVAGIILMSPWNDDVAAASEGTGQMIYSLQYPSAASFDPRVEIAACVMPVGMETAPELKNLATPVSLAVSGLAEGEKIRFLSMKGTEAMSGLAQLSFGSDGPEIKDFHPARSSYEVTASYIGGLAADASSYTVNMLVGKGGHESLTYRVITDSEMIELTVDGVVELSGTSVKALTADFSQVKKKERAITFDFLGKDGEPAIEIESDKFTLSGSRGTEVYSFYAPQCILDAEHGLALVGDAANPATLSIPNIREQQVSEVIISLDEATDVDLQSFWLEVYDGTAWVKIDGTDRRIDHDVAVCGGGLVELAIPKSSVSVTGKFRIAKSIGEGDAFIRSMTLIHEDESCTHDPASLIPAGFATGWVRVGTNNNADNGYIKEDIMIMDETESHVDDGSGSLRIGGIDCLNNFKPWQGWRVKALNIEGGATYRISVCIKTENMPANANVYLGFGLKNASNQWMTGWIPGYESKNSLDQNSSLWVDKTKGTHDWIKIVDEITLPKDAVKIDYFQVRVDNIISAPDAYAWFDDIQIVKVNK